MRNLLKNEIYRLTKEKSSLVLLILAVAIPFFTVGMVVLVARLAENMNPNISIAPPFSSIFTADFSSNNTILMIFFIIMIIGNSRDFSYGTIRNKIIAGYKRTHIYFAKQIITIAFALILVVVFLFFDRAETGENAKQVQNWGGVCGYASSSSRISSTSVDQMHIYCFFRLSVEAHIGYFVGLNEGYIGDSCTLGAVEQKRNGNYSDDTVRYYLAGYYYGKNLGVVPSSW